MRLLLDTHSFLWFAEDSPRLSATARSLIEDGGNDVLLSLASIWEMAIKVSQGKLQLGQPVLNIVNPTTLPDPTGLTAALNAVSNGNMFRDRNQAPHAISDAT